MTKVVIVHGWDGYPNEGWFPWLEQNLIQKGFSVEIPAMPDPEKPTIKAWVAKLAEVMGEEPLADTIFVAHSVGCQAVFRYLATEDVKVKGVVCVGGWFNLSPETLSDKDAHTVARPWIETTLNFAKVRKNAGKIIAIFSDNDYHVPFKEQQEFFKKNLKATIITEHDKGHMGGIDDVTELPCVLESVRALA